MNTPDEVLSELRSVFARNEPVYDERTELNGLADILAGWDGAEPDDASPGGAR